jgi:exonuclease III
MKLNSILVFSLLSLCNSFRLAQYNAEWLFIDQYENCPGSGCTWANQSEAQKHLSVVATNINNINADYINFCEVEGINELNMVADQSTYKYYSHLIKGTDTSTGQNVGVLTKLSEPMTLLRTEDRYNYPVSGSKCGCTSTGSSGVSKHYINSFPLNNFTLTIIGVHFLAYPTDSTRCAEREAQATVIRSQVDKYLNLGNEVIVMGDFNDFDEKYTDANNNIPISKVVDIIRGSELYTATSFIEKSERKTDWWDKNSDCSSVSTEFSMIDHILMTPYLYNHIKDVSIYTYPEYCGTYNSDHFPMIVDFDF